MKTRYRVNWFGKLILQVSYKVDVSSIQDPYPEMVIKWRDARVEDLLELLKPKGVESEET